jgi:cytochrome c biogenesis protein
LIPQKEGAIEFIQGLNPNIIKILEFIGLFDLYHAGWFRLLIGMLAINLVICSIDRFPSAWKRFAASPSVDRIHQFEDLPDNLMFSVNASVWQSCERISTLLNRRYRRVRFKENNDRFFFLADKGRFSHFGVYILHLSILVILLGSLVGSFFGFEGFVRIPEGEKVDSIMLRNGTASISPGFEIRCDDFTVEFYENGAPREFRSTLTFLIEGKELEKKDILVNHPVVFGGITFYQSTYERVAGKLIRLKITTSEGGKIDESLTLEIGQKIDLPGKEGTFDVLEVRHMGSVPAALISVETGKSDPTRFWIFEGFETIRSRLPEQMLRSPRFDPKAFKPYIFVLEEVQMRYATGLQANRDPGVPLVWSGFFLITAGFILTFFSSHRHIRVLVEKGKNKVHVKITGSASRNRFALERELQRLVQDIKSLFPA